MYLDQNIKCLCSQDCEKERFRADGKYAAVLLSAEAAE